MIIIGRISVWKVLIPIILVAAVGGVWIGVAIPHGTSQVNQVGAPSPRPTSSKAPSTVVKEFFAAINEHDWRQVWLLGGRYTGHGPYKTLPGMIHGYLCTKKDVVTSLTANGNIVSGYFVAYEGHEGVQTKQTYQFRYVVTRGAIRKENVILLAGHPPPGCS